MQPIIKGEAHSGVELSLQSAPSGDVYLVASHKGVTVHVACVGVDGRFVMCAGESSKKRAMGFQTTDIGEVVAR